VTLFLTVLHVVVCLLLIAVVLLQRGKGAEIGAVFGGGGGSTVFGSRGAGNFLTRLTTAAAVVFMFTSLTLAYFARDSAESTLFEEDAEAPAAATSPFEEVGEPAPAEAPAADDASPFEEVPAPAAGAEAGPEASAEGEPAAEGPGGAPPAP
jgi:preprotein translocase subunit SecG